jgi:DNA-binding transcriptional LysR family regulator
VGATDLVSLAVLSAIAETGSISAAGRATGMTQQAASERMRRLERRLGIPLLRRGARGTTLTTEGAVAAQWASGVVEAAERFATGVAALRGGAGPSAVAASLTVAEYLLPGWLLAMQASGTHDGELSVTAANSRRVLELVADGTHPLGFIESPQPTGDLTTVTVARDELVLVVGRSHAWAGRASVSLAALAGTPLVTREPGSGTRQSVEQAMSAEGHTPAPPLLELPTTAAIRTVVASGAAPAVLSILAVRDDIAAGRLVRVRVRDHRFIRELRAVHAGDGTLGPRLRSLLDIAVHGDRASVAGRLGV